jgi:hypothetical protein
MTKSDLVERLADAGPDEERRHDRHVGSRRIHLPHARAPGGAHEFERGQKKDHAHERAVEGRRQVERAAEERGRHGGEGEGPERAPVELPGAGVAGRGDGRDQDVEGQRGRPHRLGREADDGHGGEVARGAGVADRGVEGGRQEDERGQLPRFDHRRSPVPL